MRALQFTAYGGPEVLAWGDAPVPHAGPGQIRIAVRAASVNPAGWKLLAGAMSDGQPLAGTGYLGYDAAGVADEAGEGVRRPGPPSGSPPRPRLSLAYERGGHRPAPGGP